MNVRQAKDVARQWVMEEGGKLPGFHGAFHTGSTNWLPGDAMMPPTSDVDVMVVLDGDEPPQKLGKFIYRDVLLEVSFTAKLGTAEAVLADHRFAGSFRTASVIADPSGELTKLQAAVSKDYAKRTWVRTRCDNARAHSLRYLRAWKESPPFPDSVMAWLFGTGVTTHVLLVSGLKNPTVRLRYPAARELLAEYGRLDFYETLLEQLGCAEMEASRVEEHLASLAEAFDTAKVVGKTPFFFSSDISDAARPIAIDGSRDLIERGQHREAVFWIVATYARCQTVLSHDGTPEQRERFDPGFQRLLGDLGVASSAGLRERSEAVEAFMPLVWEVAEAVMAANQGIED